MTGPQISTAVILAGGFGTRLRSIVNNIPKPMAPVNDRPFLELLIKFWIGKGIHKFVISTGYLADIIEKHFSGKIPGAEIVFFREKEPLGTGGAVAAIVKSGLFSDNPVLLLNGDTWFEVSLAPLIAAIESMPKVVMCIALRNVLQNNRYGGVELAKSGLIESFGNESSTLINGGCYLLRPGLLIPWLANLPPVFSLEQNLLPVLAQKKLLLGVVENGEFIDIGIPEDYRRFQEYAGAIKKE